MTTPSYYHGTTNRAAKAIQDEGWLGSEISQCTSTGRHVAGGVVYMTTSIEEAMEYGNVVFEIHPEGIDIYPFSDGNTDHYYAYAEAVNEQAWWEIVE